MVDWQLMTGMTHWENIEVIWPSLIGQKCMAAILRFSGPFFSPSQSSVVLFSYCTKSLSVFLFAPYYVLLITVWCWRGRLRFVLSSSSIPRLFLQRLQRVFGAFCLLLWFINNNRIRFFPTFLFTPSFCLRVLRAPLPACLPANGPSVIAAAWLVAVQGAPAMPLVKRVLGFDTELTGGQSWLEAADVVKRGV